MPRTKTKEIKSKENEITDMWKEHYDKYKTKFGSKYYAEKYKQFNCRLKLEDYERLKDFMKENNIGFTEFIKSAIALMENKKIKTEKRLE